MRDEELIQVCWGINCRELPYRIVKKLNEAFQQQREYIEYQGLFLATKTTSQIPHYDVEFENAYKKGYFYCKSCGLYSHKDDFEYGYIMCYDYIKDNGYSSWQPCKGLAYNYGKKALHFRKQLGFKPGQTLLPRVEKKLISLISGEKALMLIGDIDKAVQAVLRQQEEEDRILKTKGQTEESLLREYRQKEDEARIKTQKSSEEEKVQQKPVIEVVKKADTLR